MKMERWNIGIMEEWTKKNLEEWNIGMMGKSKK